MLMLAYLRLTREIATLVPHSDPPVPGCWPSLEWPSPGKVYSVQFTTHCTGSVLTVAIFMVLCLQVVCSLEVKSSSSSFSSCLLGLESSSGLTLNTSSVQMIYSFPSYSYRQVLSSLLVQDLFLPLFSFFLFSSFIVRLLSLLAYKCTLYTWLDCGSQKDEICYLQVPEREEELEFSVSVRQDNLLSPEGKR